MIIKNRQFSTVKNLPSKYPDADFTESSIRWWLFNSKDNGFSKCVVRVGRKILIDVERFEEWLDNQAAEGNSL